jgi:hypothetical protein
VWRNKNPTPPALSSTISSFTAVHEDLLRLTAGGVSHPKGEFVSGQLLTSLTRFSVTPTFCLMWINKECKQKVIKTHLFFNALTMAGIMESFFCFAVITYF